MKLGIVVQARMSSRRLPGKVALPLAGRPLLAWLVGRLRQVASPLPIVVATSVAPEDDAVEALARSLAVECYRGPLHDVLARLSQAAERAGFSAFVRANGDSPFLDPALVEQAHALFRETRCDLVTNVFPRSFPKGMSVELLSAEAARRILRSTQDRDDREHVTRFAYAHPEGFGIRNFSASAPCPGLQLSVDTREDLERLDACVRRLGAHALQAGWQEFAACLG